MKHWWDKLQPLTFPVGQYHNKDIYADGQIVTRVFGRERKHRQSKRSLGWEYAIVEYSDDGEFHHAYIIHNGKMKIVRDDE